MLNRHVRMGVRHRAEECDHVKFKHRQIVVDAADLDAESAFRAAPLLSVLASSVGITARVTGWKCAASG